MPEEAERHITVMCDGQFDFNNWKTYRETRLRHVECINFIGFGPQASDKMVPMARDGQGYFNKLG